jgi:ribosomal protein S18 acetylase RimI-like enzyme
LKIRLAKKSDRDIVLQFCTDTFTWGDYIDRVFDLWYHEPHGKLFVAEEDTLNRNDNYVCDPSKQHKTDAIITNTTANVQPIALSHVVLCPNKTRLWIEGIRVKQNYRRNKVATALVDEMLEYGRRQGAIEASAIISVNNMASRLLFENKGFNVVSKWGYYNIQINNNEYNQINNKNSSKDKVKKRIATLQDADDVWDYLQGSKTYRLSGKRYFESWRWYPLDHKKIIDFVRHHKVIIVENNNSMVEGVAIINDTRYWDKTEVFQIVYLDAPLMSQSRNLVLFCVDLRTTSLSDNTHDNSKNNKNNSNRHNLNQLQIISYQTNELSAIMSHFNIVESAQFFLYYLSL